MGNNPISNVDILGDKSFFVNGYWRDEWYSGALGADKPYEPYWGNGFKDNAQEFFNDKGSFSFLDGRGSWASSAAERYNMGFEWAKENTSLLTYDINDKKEPLFFWMHSQGCAYGTGIADYLISIGYNVKAMVYLGVHQGGDIKVPQNSDFGSISSYSLSYFRDPIVENPITGGEITGVTKSGVSYKNWLTMWSAHGHSAQSSVFSDLTNLLNSSTISINGYSYQYPTPKNLDSYFTRINGVDLKTPDGKEEISKKLYKNYSPKKYHEDNALPFSIK